MEAFSLIFASRVIVFFNLIFVSFLGWFLYHFWVQKRGRGGTIFPFRQGSGAVVADFGPRDTLMSHFGCPTGCNLAPLRLLLFCCFTRLLLLDALIGGPILANCFTGFRTSSSDFVLGHEVHLRRPPGIALAFDALVKRFDDPMVGHFVMHPRICLWDVTIQHVLFVGGFKFSRNNLCACINHMDSYG